MSEQKSFNILLLPGDGIGPEVTDAVRQVLAALGTRFGLDFKLSDALIGGAAIDATGEPLPAATLAAAQAADAIFLGAVGGPKWDGAAVRPEAGLLGLRKALGLFANLRPVSLVAGLEHLSPLKAERVAGADVMIVRELTGGLYFGDKKLDENTASDSCTYTTAEVERIARIAFETARLRRSHVTSVDKANVLATSKLWRRVVDRVAADYPDVGLDHMLVDAAAMALVMHPARFDVLLTENLFGDILSDEASVLAGSIGLLGSASLSGDGPGLFEPIHGSAPDIAGQDKANPVGAFASTAMLLDLGLGLAEPAAALRAAVSATLGSGVTTTDLGGDASCSDVARIVTKNLAD